MGLLRAVKNSTPPSGTNSALCHLVDPAIDQQAYCRERGTIRPPVHMYESISRVIRIQRNMMQTLGREPTLEEIALESDFIDEDVSEKIKQALATHKPIDQELVIAWDDATDKIKNILKTAEEPVSLERPIGDEDNSTLADFIEDQDAAAHWVPPPRKY